jgi:hypothetical protein
MGIVEAHGQKPPLAIEYDSQVARRALVALLANRPGKEPRVPLPEGSLGTRGDANGDIPTRGLRSFRESRSSSLSF